MFGSADRPLKRRASDSAQVYSSVTEPCKKRRLEEAQTSARASSLPEGQVFGVAGFGTGPLYPEASSNNFPSPCGQELQQNVFSSPAPQIRAQEQQFTAASPSTFPTYATNWARQPSLPGCSDLSEQTMDDVPSSTHNQQVSGGNGEEMQGSGLATQRSNSAPDLRLLLDGNINPIPQVIFQRSPVLESSSLAGALVPFKAPEEVVRDAVRVMLEQSVREAVDSRKETPPAAKPEDQATEQVAADSANDVCTVPMELA